MKRTIEFKDYYYNRYARLVDSLLEYEHSKPNDLRAHFNIIKLSERLDELWQAYYIFTGGKNLRVVYAERNMIKSDRLISMSFNSERFIQSYLNPDSLWEDFDDMEYISNGGNPMDI